MFDEDRNSENMLVKEPQLEILYYSKPQTEKKKDTLNVLSLFSGCGGWIWVLKEDFLFCHNQLTKD